MSKPNLTKQIQKIIIAKIEHNGFKMTKKLSSGGLFGYPTYDNRTVYSLESLNKLNEEGFSVDEDIELFLFNAIMYPAPNSDKEQ